MKEEIERELIFYLDTFLKSYYGDIYEYSISNYDGILVYAINKKDAKNKFQVLRVTIDENYEQIYIPTIFIPIDLQHQGLGKKLILLVFKISRKFNYELFMVQLVDSFKEKLLARGALETDQPDILAIVETTNLLG